ncbi:MAG TPA: MBL fold metallo-hydrolase [Trebonia sp.]|jgi:glyoxylase-like metal-dependent hydrolase (beta-lactamase superfamily II)
MEIAKGLHRLGSKDIINSYLVIDESGVTVIDAGVPGYWTLLQRELEQLDLTLDHVRALVLTHGDTDHIGFAARLSKERASQPSCTPETTSVPAWRSRSPAAAGDRSSSAPWPVSCGTPRCTAG